MVPPPKNYQLPGFSKINPRHQERQMLQVAGGRILGAKDYVCNVY